MSMASPPTLTRPIRLTAALAVLAGLPALLYPPGRDQAVFLLAGRALADGRVPYLEFWDLKPPGLFLAYMGPAALAGTLPGAAALLDLAALALAILVLGRLAATAGLPAAGPAAGVLLAGLWILGADWWDLGQGEKLAAPLLLGLLLLAWRRGRGAAAGAGACVAGLFLIKYSLPAMALACLPLLGGERQAPGAASSQRRLAALAGGCALALAPVGVWLLATGAAAEAWTASIEFTSHYTRLAWQHPSRLASAAALTGWSFVRGTWSLWLLAGAALALPLPPAARRLRGALLLALAAGLVTVLGQGKFFPYHWAVLWPFLALLAGLGAAAAGRRLAGDAVPRSSGGAAGVPEGPGPGAGNAAAVGRCLPLVLALLAAAGAGLAAAPGAQGWWASLQTATGRLPRAEQRALFRVQGMGADELERVAAGIAAATSPADTVYLWGFEPSFYLAVGRSYPGRFPFSYPLVAPWAPPAWRTAFMAEFRRAAPRYVVVRRGDPIPWVAGVEGDAATRLRRFPALAAELSRRYAADADLSSRHLQVLRRLPGPAPAGSASTAGDGR